MAKKSISVSLTIGLPDGSTIMKEFTTDEQILIGSGESAHVELKDKSVSKVHCMLKPKEFGVTVTDLGSDDGTALNGTDISKETDLNDGDVLTVGKTKIAVHFAGEHLAPTVPARAFGATIDVESAEDDAPKSKVAAKSKGKPASKKSAAAAPHHGVQHNVSSSSTELDPAITESEKASDKHNVDVTMVWGGSVIGVARLSKSGSVIIGENARATFRISDTSIPSSAYELVKLTAEGAVIQVVSGMELEIDGQKQSANRVVLDLGKKAVVRVGAVEFVIQYAKKYGAITLGLFDTLDYLYSKIFALAMIAQIGLVVAFLMTPKFSNDEEDDLFANLNEFTQLLLTKQEKKKEKKEDLSGKQGAKAKDEEGLFGKKDKPKEDKLASKKGAPVVDKDKREEDRQKVSDALALLNLSGESAAVSNEMGPGGLGTGINNSLGGLKGASTGDAGGAGGLGARGTGGGGGGNGLGIGGIGSGTGRGSGGRGGVDLGGKGKGMTRVMPGKVTSQGSLSREEIERVLSRVKNQIRFCYEKELNKNPNLEGKIVAQWTINGTGKVSTSKVAQNTMASDSVGECVVRIIQRLEFPQPRGGGNVYVTYPYVFAPG